MKKTVVFFLLFILTVACAGCNTLKGAAEDANIAWQKAKKADDWLQHNAW